MYEIVFCYFIGKYILISMNLGNYTINVISFQGLCPWTPLGELTEPPDPHLDAVSLPVLKSLVTPDQCGS